MTALVGAGARGRGRGNPSGTFRPGGVGDRAVYGYMFRLIVTIASVLLSFAVVAGLGYWNGWAVGGWSLWLSSIICTVLIGAGEHLRTRVYERYRRKAGGEDVAATGLKIGYAIASRNSQWQIEINPASVLPPSVTLSPIRFRIVDTLISFVIIFFFGALFVIVPLLIKFDSRGPVLSKSQARRADGSVFPFYRFRTTQMESDELTHVGAFLEATAIDILPGLFNVLFGDLSLIGYRPVIVQTENAGEQRRAYPPTVGPGLLVPWSVVDARLKDRALINAAWDRFGQNRSVRQYLREITFMTRLIITIHSKKRSD